MKITIDCTEEQAEIIVAALEDYFRLRMGQADHMAQSLADNTYKWDKDNPDNKRLFDMYLVRRENLNYVYRALISIAYGSRLAVSDTCHGVSMSSANACDIWRCLRHELYMTSDCDKRTWDVRGDKPIQLGTIDLPKIEVER